MPKNTLNYIISLILCLTASVAQAQKKIIESAPTIKEPVYYGFNVQADLASVIGSALAKGETYSYEASIQADLKHKYYPVIELGFSGADKITDNNINFTTDAPFGRIGVDLNLLKKKEGAKPTNNAFIAGVRLGMTNFKYQITNIQIENGYWENGNPEILNFTDIPCSKVWWEFVAGVRVEVIKNIYLGWTVRTKGLLSQQQTGEISPWYIPGFGKSTGANWGLNYTIGYHF